MRLNGSGSLLPLSREALQLASRRWGQTPHVGTIKASLRLGGRIGVCGFAAIFERDRTFDPELIGKIDKDLFHRGPDSGGQLSETGVALVFRRLAILDLRDEANQPMTDASGRYVIVFNGEIYNFGTLRCALEAAGTRFRTTGDTEVVLEGFVHWGEAVVERLEGMFAFVIWDRQTGDCLAARDPFGIKPLYIVHQGGLTAFASEMRPLRRLIGTAVDPAALAELLVYRFAAGRLSNLKNIEQVPGGMLVRRRGSDGQVNERRYCDVLETIQPEPHPDDGNVEELVADAVNSSIKAHLISDVGYALQLSGGVDSSLLTALVSARSGKRLTTYGIDLGDLPQNERQWRDMVVRRFELDHHEVALDDRAFADALPRAVRAMEGPLPHLGCVMLMLLCQRIRQTDKVVLTGEGADEIFGGYHRYGVSRTITKHVRASRMVPSALWPFLGRYRWLRRYASYEPAAIASVYFDVTRLSQLFPDIVPRPGAREKAAARFTDFRDRMTAVDQTAYLASLLMRQDKMSMSASVEARVPFTHLPLARVVNRIPRDIRVPGGETKPILKEIARKWLPTKLVDRRKVGLNLPYDSWLGAASGLGRYLEFITAPDSAIGEIGDRQAILRYVDAFRSGRTRHTDFPVVHLVNMETWLRSLREPPLPLAPR